MSDSYFFCGIGGSGMSALALILAGQGHKVSGSDRSRDKGETPAKFAALERQGITLYPQDGTGPASGIGTVVVSSAIEESVPDIRAARENNIPVKKRAEVLSGLLNAARGIAVGGTSGKTTVTGMISHMLNKLGLDPTVMNGGHIIDFPDKGEAENFRAGGGDLFVSETDESDGSIVLFHPAIAVVNNITLDHKPLDDLRPMFKAFVSQANEAAVINIDDPEAAALAGVHANTIMFSLSKNSARLCAQDIRPAPGGISFKLVDSATDKKIEVRLNIPGRHNVSNALAALSVAVALGLDLDAAVLALESFRGTKRRFEIVGTASGITVIDDFGHNPDKIAATLQTLKEFEGRLLVFFQPHGYGPTRMLKQGLIDTFVRYLGPDDILLMPEIYYAGGTATKDISSRDITDAVQAAGKKARFFEKRVDIRPYISREAKPGDRIVIMGARDDTLSDFARDIVAALRARAA